MMCACFEIFTFYKPYDIRRQEYNEIFMQASLNVCPMHITEIWVSYLETILEPTGWTALWKMTPNLGDNHINYSSILQYVMVDSLNFDTLSADVTVLDNGNSEDTKFYGVPLKDLFPTKSQENNSLSIEITAKCIDQLRIFYEYLWRPWDVHTEGFAKYVNWISVYLEMRLKLYYSFVVDRKYVEYTVSHIWTLTIKGHKLFKLICSLDQLSIGERDRSVTLKYENELLQLISDISYWENNWKNNKTEDIVESSAVIVMKLLTEVEEYVNNFEQLEDITPSKWNVVTDLPSSMPCSKINITIFTADEIYSVYDMTCLTQGGIVNGLNEERRPTIKDAANCETSLCDLYGSGTFLSNVIFSVDNCTQVMVMHPGCKLSMNKVQILHTNSSSSSIAIVVYNDASLIANECHFEGFGIAIVAFPQSYVDLKCCTFKTKIGIEAFDGAEVHFDNTDESIMQSADPKYLLPLLKLSK